jgi:hypothetical protein
LTRYRAIKPKTSMTKPPRTILYISQPLTRSRDSAMTYNATAMNTPAAMNKGLTGAFWKNGATTEAVKVNKLLTKVRSFYG